MSFHSGDRVKDTTTGMVGTVIATPTLLGRQLTTIRWDDSTMGSDDTASHLAPFNDAEEEQWVSERLRTSGWDLDVELNKLAYD